MAHPCIHCGQPIENDNLAPDGKVACPKCGETVILPSVLEQGPPLTGTADKPPLRPVRLTGKDVVIGVCAVVIVALLLLLFLKPNQPARQLVFGGSGPTQATGSQQAGSAPSSPGGQGGYSSPTAGSASGSASASAGNTAGSAAQPSGATPLAPVGSNRDLAPTLSDSPNTAAGTQASGAPGSSASPGQPGDSTPGASSQSPGSSSGTPAPLPGTASPPAQPGITVGGMPAPSSASAPTSASTQPALNFGGATALPIPGTTAPGSAPSTSGAIATPANQPGASMPGASSPSSAPTSAPTQPGLNSGGPVLSTPRNSATAGSPASTYSAPSTPANQPGVGLGSGTALTDMPQDGTPQSTGDLLPMPTAETSSGPTGTPNPAGGSPQSVSASTLAQQAAPGAQITPSGPEQPGGSTNNTASAADASQPSSPDHNPSHSSTPPMPDTTTPLDPQRGSNVVFALDRSMDGEKSTAARQELVQILGGLGTNQSFFVLFFDSSGYDGMPAPGLLRATTENIRSLTNWIFSADQRFGSDPTKAMLRALQLNPDTVWLLSDGGFSSEAREQIHLANDSVHARINTLGFFSRSGETILRRIAEENGGTYRFVPSPKEKDALEHGVATDASSNNVAPSVP